MFQNIGNEIYKSWSDEQRRDEIGKLVQGYRGGVPVDILCLMASAIAGGDKKARKIIASFMPREERETALAKTADDQEKLRQFRPILL